MAGNNKGKKGNRQISASFIGPLLKGMQRTSAKPKKGKANKLVPAAYSMSLDIHAAKWQNLLLDPCAADLTAPVTSDGSMAGYVQRFSGTIDFVGGSTVNAVLKVTPNFLGVANSILSATNASGADFTIGTSPDIGAKTFLLNNSRAYRTVACCVDFIYSGTTLDHAGIFYGGVGNTDVFFVGDVVAQADLTQICQYAVRTPNMCVLKYRPSAEDLIWMDTASTLSGIQSQSCSAMYAYVHGMTPGSTIAARITWVVEWMPKRTIGLSTNIGAGNRSRNTQSQVVADLDNRRPGWNFDPTGGLGYARPRTGTPAGRAVAAIATGIAAMQAR